MAQPRPYVINAEVIKLLFDAPVSNMRPSLGSLVQRKTIDIGCYPFPFMVNEDNVPLDGRTAGGVRLPIRIVPFWCSENTYAKYPGDSTYNNGRIVWIGGKGYVKSNLEGNNLNLEPLFLYDQTMGVTYTQVRYNSAFITADNTVPKEWVDIKNAVYGSGDYDAIQFSEGITYEISNNVLFKAWSGLTVEQIERSTDPGGANTYAFRPMLGYISAGGTFSPIFDRYNYECLDQIFNSERFLNVGIEPNSFWEGIGASYGTSGGLTGELFLLNAVTGGANSGSYYILAVQDGLLDSYLFKGFSGATLSGKNLAKNLFGIANENPYIGVNEKVSTYGNNSGFVDTMAFLLGTSQKFVTLAGTGGTASIRALDFNNPCSASFVYDESTELGRWGYEVQPIGIEEDNFVAGEDEIGCNVNTFVEYLSGATAKAHGIVHPLSWMFWRGVCGAGAPIAKYSQGFMHDFVGLDETDNPIYNKLEGIHDYICYEHFDNNGLLDRIYYPIRPITSQWYSQNIAPLYNNPVPGQAEAQQFGLTLDKKYDTAFTVPFKGAGSLGDISLRSLEQGGQISINFDGVASNINGVTGILFPYFIPLASFAMKGINTNFPGNVEISGEFSKFEFTWTKALFDIPEDQPASLKQLYQYYADGVSSDADFGTNNDGSPSSPFNKQMGGAGFPNFRLFSWNALSRISPFNVASNFETIVKSSFEARNEDKYGRAEYFDPNVPNRILLNGIDVDIDPLNYPPSALPNSSFIGLTYTTLDGDLPVVVDLGCASYVNVIRYANTTEPNVATVGNAFGLTAERELIVDEVIGASKKSFSEFDPDKLITANPSLNFARVNNTSFPNGNSDFFATSGSVGNFFFVTPSSADPLAVFENSYYLTAAEYFQKYGGQGGANPSVNWWEDIDMNGLLNSAGWVDIPALANDIATKLRSPFIGDKWADPDFVSSGFRGESFFNPDPDFPTNPDPDIGILQALNQNVHPAFIYRLFTTNILRELGIEDSCAASWSVGGQPCHKLPSVIDGLKSSTRIYNSYFNGLNLCLNGTDTGSPNDFVTNLGKDFFAGCAVAVREFGGSQFLLYAYDPSSNSGYPYSPFPEIPNSNPYYDFRNPSCQEGQNLPDPPQNAALTQFGLQFAEALAIAENETVDFADRLQVRNLFGYTGNTASTNGTNGSEPSVPTVSDWLQGKVGSIFDKWNNLRPTGDPKLPKLELVLDALYPTEFPQYKASFANSTTFRVWAVKPKCVEKWTPECSDLANKLRNETSVRRLSTTSPRSYVFRDEVVNSAASPDKRIISPPYGYNNTITVNQTIPLTTGNIITENEGFLGSIKTIFIEPLGLATNVLASEAQAVPRATISSTVLGKLTTIIDSSGFLRDVNEITFESGFGIKILGDNATGNISFSITGLTLGSLEDVSVTGATSGDILIFDGESGKWINRPFADVVQPFLAGFTGFTGSFESGTNFFYQDSAPDAGITIGSRWMNSNTGIEYIYINDGDSFQWIQSSVDVTAETPTYTYNTTLVTGSEYAALDTDYYIGVSYAGEALIQLPSDPSEGKTVIVKDASGMASYGNRKITVVGADAADTIDNEESAIINVNNGALQFIYKNGWRII